jgi:2-polyprenyl-6-methoxyphenol hydroxylase-like FAD-dependent oxidoreductase
VFEATSHRTEPYTTILAQNLSLIKRLMADDEHGQDVWPTHVGPPVHANVDRATLRQILLTGLDDRVHYGKTLERYESKEGGVVAYFSDGTTSAGHVLVGADGIRSAVRQQRCVLNTPINVTLLGDAIHAMTPTLGRGANVAMRDGALLGRELKTVADGSIALDDALGSYERQMLEYGFAVVREAAQIGQQRMAQNPLPA